MKRSAFIRVIIAALALLLFPISARAGCSNPTDSEKKLMYNTDYHTYQFCNGTSWVTAGQAGADPQTFGDTTVEASMLLQRQLFGGCAGNSGGGRHLQGISIYINSVDGNLRLGLYDATGPSGGPGAKKAETNGFATTTGWNTANVITPVTLTAGTYWLSICPTEQRPFRQLTGDVWGVALCFRLAYRNLPATSRPRRRSWSKPGALAFYSSLPAPLAGTHPAVEGNIIYNKDYHTLQYCNGASGIP